MSQITISHLTFGYDGSAENVFDDLTLTLDTDWRLGLIGRNGRGKTTLTRLLAGELTGRGRISMPLPCRRFPCPVAHPERPTRAVLQEAAPAAADWQIACEAGRIGLPEAALDRPFATLSGGEQTRALLADMFLAPDAFLLIDEPTNHLNAAARAQVAAYLARQRGFLLVSHDRAFLDRCVDHILALGRTGPQLQAGNFSSWWQNRQRQEAHERAENQRLRGEIDRLQAAARQAAARSHAIEQAKFGGKKENGLRPDRGFIGHKSAKMMKRAKAITARTQAAAAEKAGLLREVERTDRLALAPLQHHAARLVEVRDGYVPLGGRQLCAGLRLEVGPGDRVALAGPNGAGKSTLLRLLAGQAVPYTGQVVRAPGLRVSYVPQDTGGLSGTVQDYAAACGVDLTQMLTLLRKLDFPRALFARDMAGYSAGQKKKVLLARSLCERAHLYLWDEPLNYIDVFSRMQLEALLQEAQAAMVFVEHDQAFVSRTATQVLTLG